MNYYAFFQRTIFITGFITYIIALLSQASFATPLAQASSADICRIALQPGMTSSTQEFKDIIDVAKVISFLRQNKRHSRLPNRNRTIHPIDILLASLTIVVEVDNDQNHIVKANLTKGIIFNSLKSLREGALLFDLQNRIWEELNDPIKKHLSILRSYKNGYILTLDRRHTNSFDNIISKDMIFDKESLHLLRKIKTEGNGNAYIDPRNLLFAMIQSHNPYFIYELFSSQLTEELGFFGIWLGDNQRRIDEIISIISNSTNTSSGYISILELQMLYYTSRRGQDNGNKEAQPSNTNIHLLRKFGFPGESVARSMHQIENDNLSRLRIRIKRRILRNTSSNEVREVETSNDDEIDALVNENDIRNFLKYHRNFTDEEIELFMKSFMQDRENIEPETNDTMNNDSTTTPILHPRQQLIQRLNRMDQDKLEAFIREVDFEVSSDFIHNLMDPQKVPKDVKDVFIRFIADVSQAGSIFSIRTSNNAYGFKKVSHFNKRNKKHQRNSVEYHSLHLGWNWVLLVREEENIFTLDRITSHATYKKYF